MTQTVIVILIVAAALFFAVRRLVRTIRGKGTCNCGCNRCPHGGNECRCHSAGVHLPEVHLDE